MYRKGKHEFGGFIILRAVFSGLTTEETTLQIILEYGTIQCYIVLDVQVS